MAANRPCECGVCVFGRQQEITDYQCDLELLVPDLGHVHHAVWYVRGHVAAHCSECDERLPQGALRCQQPHCGYALCLQCAPKQFGGDCWGSNQFVNQEISSEFECVLCSNISKQIVELQCGHTFGSQCLQRMMQIQPAPHKCPLCQTKFTPDQVSPSWSNRLKILSFDAYCCHQASGCSFRGTLAAVVRHQINHCDYRRMTCTLPGCHAEFALLAQADHHRLHCQVLCPAPDCGQRLSRTALTEHVLQHHLPRLHCDQKQWKRKFSESEQKHAVLLQENQQLQLQIQQLQDSQAKQEEKYEIRDITSIGSVVRHLPVLERDTHCYGVAVSGGRLYLSNFSNHVVDVVDEASGGRVARYGTFHQEGEAAVGQPPRFRYPWGVAVDEIRSVVYVVDWLNHCVVVVRLCDGLVEAVWGSSGSGQQQLQRPTGLAYCPNTDLLYVADSSNDCVKVLRGSDGHCVQVLTGCTGRGSGSLNRPCGVAVDPNHIYIADTSNDRLLVYAKQTGAFLFQMGQGQGSGKTQFNHPYGVSVDSEAGVVYVADYHNHRVCVYRSADGSYVCHFKVLKADKTKAKPLCATWNAQDGVLYVTTRESSTVFVYSG